MKILKWLLILGGVGLCGLGVYSMFFKPDTAINQIIGMMGVGALTIVAGFAIKNRR